MGTHHRAEHLSRQGEVVLIHAAFNQQRSLYQIGELFKQLLWQIGVCLKRGRCLLHGGADPLGPLAAVHLHTRCRQSLVIGLCAADRHRSAMETVAAAAIAAHHLGITALEPHGHHLAIEHGHEPAHGARETAFARTPAHEATALKRADPLRNPFTQELRG